MTTKKANTTKTKKALQRRIDELTAQIEQVHGELRTLRGSDRRTRQWQRRRVLQECAGQLGAELRQTLDALIAL